MAVMPEIYGRLRELFRERLHGDVPAADTDLLESGFLDSLRFVALLAHIESEFGISIPLAELELERVGTLAALAELVGELRESRDGPQDDRRPSQRGGGDGVDLAVVGDVHGSDAPREPHHPRGGEVRDGGDPQCAQSAASSYI